MFRNNAFALEIQLEVLGSYDFKLM